MLEERATFISNIFLDIQGVSRLVVITAGGDFLGLCNKKVYINMCPILRSYGYFLILVHALV
jgi:hypothetical protein